MESLKSASLALITDETRECDSIHSKENIQAGYRNGSQIVN